MKTKNLLFVVFFGLISFKYASAQKNSNETAAIKKVIDLETRAYFEMKYDLWASTWLHDSSAYRMTMSPTGFSKTEGWNNINAGMKESMQKATPYTEEEMAPYLHKFDYKFYINGNTANVFFKEGKTGKNANDETRLMVKQNGEWKIAGLTIVTTPIYNFNNDVQKLKTFIGKWNLAKGSDKSDPSDTAFKVLSLSVDVHEIMNGIEVSSVLVNRYAGNTYSTQDIEQFVQDNNLNKFWYFYNSKSSNGSSGDSGTAEFDSSGNFVVTVMYDNKPVVKFKNIYTMNKDASLHFSGEFHNSDGKKINSWSYDLIRM